MKFSEGDHVRHKLGGGHGIYTSRQHQVFVGERLVVWWHDGYLRKEKMPPADKLWADYVRWRLSQ